MVILEVFLELFEEEFFFSGDLILWSSCEGIFIFWVLLKGSLKSDEDDWFFIFLFIWLEIWLFVVEEDKDWFKGERGFWWCDGIGCVIFFCVFDIDNVVCFSFFFNLVFLLLWIFFVLDSVLMVVFVMESICFECFMFMKFDRDEIFFLLEFFYFLYFIFSCFI